MTRSPAYRLWQPAELALLADLYPHIPTGDVAALLERKHTSVYNKAHALGLRKTAEFHASEASGRVGPDRPHHPAMVATQFKPGFTPWNKGQRYTAGGRSIATQFKPGSKPHTTVPVGSYRIHKSNNTPALQQKVSDTPGASNLRWRTVAELVWVHAHGPLQPGHIVVFKPGMRSLVLEDITLDKLECITRAEHARRNHPRNKSPELARLVQLKGAITRQVNRINREAAPHQAGHTAHHQPTQAHA